MTKVISEQGDLNRQHVVVDLGDGVDPAQPHGGEELVADDVDRLGEIGRAHV